MAKKKFTLKKVPPSEKVLREQYKKFADIGDMVKPKYGKRKRSFSSRKYPIYKKRKLSKKRFVKLAKRIKACTTEIKQMTYNLVSFTKKLVYTNRTDVSIDLMNLVWPAQGTGDGQRIGDEIFVRYLIVEVIASWDNTNFADQPHRWLIAKSKTTTTNFTVGDFLDPIAINGSDSNYVTTIKQAGARIIHDKFMRCPGQLDLETAAADAESFRTQSYKKTIKIMKNVKRLATDSSFWNIATYCMTILKPSDLSVVGTGPNFEVNVRIFYQDP